MITDLSFLPERPAKPRTSGLTMVMDKGLSLREAEDFMSVGKDYTDFVKLGFGTGIITPGVEKKIELYKDNGMLTYFGGTLFEAFVVRNSFKDYIKLIQKTGVPAVEVSDGSFGIETKEKCRYIRELSFYAVVLSEVGSKKKDVVFSPDQWVEMMQAELEAGSFKVIAEARETGTIGIYNDDGSVNSELIEKLSKYVGFDNILWEAPQKSQQAWFIKHFGANVNLGNIAPTEIISLESLRLGLRGDTFFQFLPDQLK